MRLCIIKQCQTLYITVRRRSGTGPILDFVGWLGNFLDSYDGTYVYYLRDRQEMIYS